VGHPPVDGDGALGVLLLEQDHGQAAVGIGAARAAARVVPEQALVGRPGASVVPAGAVGLRDGHQEIGLALPRPWVLGDETLVGLVGLLGPLEAHEQSPDGGQRLGSATRAVGALVEEPAILGQGFVVLPRLAEREGQAIACTYAPPRRLPLQSQVRAVQLDRGVAASGLLALELGELQSPQRCPRLGVREVLEQLLEGRVGAPAIVAALRDRHVIDHLGGQRGIVAVGVCECEEGLPAAGAVEAAFRRQLGPQCQQLLPRRRRQRRCRREREERRKPGLPGQSPHDRLHSSRA